VTSGERWRASALTHIDPGVRASEDIGFRLLVEAR
jgi:hypothetical protein